MFSMSRHNVFNVATFSRSRDIASTKSRHVAKAFKIFQSSNTYPNSWESSLLMRTLTKKLKFQIKILKHMNHNSSLSSIFKTLPTMSNPSSPTLNKVIEKIIEEVQGERAEQPKNQETTLLDEVKKEVKEVEGDSKGAKVFQTNKGIKIFKKTLAKKGFIGERGFKELAPPFKEEIERRGWDMLYKHMEPSKRTLSKEFYENLKDRKNLTCYVKGKWVPFAERALSRLFKLKEGENCSEFEKLKKNTHFDEFSKELTSS